MQTFIQCFNQASSVNDIAKGMKALEENDITKLPGFSETIREASGDASPEDMSAVYQAIVDATTRIFTLRYIRTPEQMAQAKMLISYLNGMYCTAFNRNYDDVLFEQISKTLSSIQGLILAHTKRQRIKDKDVALLARYAVSSRYYTNTNATNLLTNLYEAGVLVKETCHDGATRLLIKGLHARVGNNVTRLDSRGRECLMYQECIFPQLFIVSSFGFKQDAWQRIIQSLPFFADIPEADTENSEVTYIGYGKNQAKSLPVKWDQAHHLLRQRGCLL